ncbi:MAG: hypothetical protein EA426_13780 [Spirochaetaceae bacterium]|nr:MAG: hypothetical protein EA426_13780 [Spirochaetaceae bacterium]
MKRRTTLAAYRPDGTGYQEFSREFVSRLTRALRKESWGRNFIQLAWTAGPVTYLALNGGYYIGFGVAAPPELFLYFGGYTIIAGIFAVAVRIGYNVLHGAENERMEVALTDVMGRIPELIAEARNRSLETYDGADRVFLAAKYLLDNTDATEQTVGQAILDLTDDVSLATAIRSIEVYRRAGLFERARDVQSTITDQLASALPTIESRSVSVAEQVRRRFAGVVTPKHQGRARIEGFIERTLAAGESDGYDLMSLSDVEEVLTLAFELLAGRSFTYFSLQYVGATALRDLERRFERARRELREAIHVRNSRLRVLAEFLNESEAIHRVPAAIPVIHAIDDVLQNVRRAVDDVFSEMQKRTIGENSRFTPDEVRTVRTVLHLWGALHRANEAVGRRHTTLGRVLKEYEGRVRSTRSAAQILGPRETGDGVRLLPRQVSLTVTDRMRLALKLAEVINDTALRTRFARAPSGDAYDAGSLITGDGYKHVAVSAAILIDQVIELGNGELQSAIESSAAANVGSIEANLSRESRIGWGVALVREIHNDVGTAAGRLVASLAYYHGMRITSEAIEHLVEAYGAQESLLRRFSVDNSASDPPSTPRSLDGLSGQFLDVNALPRVYNAVAEKMQRRVRERVGR